MRRLALFARSVITEDPYQLSFLAGSVVLFICMQLRCFPIVSDYVPGVNVFLFGSQADPFASAYQSWLRFSLVARLPIVFAGAAGLFICFWPGSHPVRRILIFVLLPAFAGIAAICGRFVSLAQHSDFPHASVVLGTPHSEIWALSTVWSLGPAVHMSVLGFTLVLVFVLRLATKISSLPLSLGHAGRALPSQDAFWKRILVVVWISIAGMSVIGAGAGASFWGVYSLIVRFTNFRSLPPEAPLVVAVSTACLAGIAAWAVGESRWKELRQFFRLPEAKFAVLAVIFPIGIELLPNLVAYLTDRVHWAAFEFGRFAPPYFASYFYSPQPIYFWYLFAAGFEEVTWRGYLQPRFVQRFGIIRGIFLLGLAWGAFHFLGDFRKTTEDYQVLLTFTSRLTFCISISYALGWLTLRSGSVWPAALVHGLNNVWAFSGAYSLEGRQSIFLTRMIIAICWGLLGFALFRFWPPSIATEMSGRVQEMGTSTDDLNILQ
jgi:membrane protease YdiL (CAAX protease family)